MSRLFKKNTMVVSAVISAALLLSACSDGDTSSSSREPVYNEVRYSAPDNTQGSAFSENKEAAPTTDPISRPESSSAGASVPSPVGSTEIGSFTPVGGIRNIARGNSFEEDANFGHFCAVDNGYYYVDLNDGFLYFTDSDGNTSSVLNDYVRALNYYDGYLYYIKGTKSEFLAKEHFYAGSIWRLDPVSGAEICLIDVPENMSFSVNEYGIIAHPDGGGLALYDLDGKETERLSNENQSVCIIGNKLCLRNDGKTVLRDLDTGEESDFPENMLMAACVGDKLVCADMNDQWSKMILNLSTGEARRLPQSSAFVFAVCNGELYAADNDNLYRVDLENARYESVISYQQGSPVYFFALHSDGERLYALMRNQLNESRLAEVDIERGELKYPEDQ